MIAEIAKNAEIEKAKAKARISRELTRKNANQENAPEGTSTPSHAKSARLWGPRPALPILSFAGSSQLEAGSCF